MGDSCAQLSKGKGITITCCTEHSDILDFLGEFWGLFGLLFLVGFDFGLVGRLRKSCFYEKESELSSALISF